jgi:rRNA maturation endonuclease Nob1
MFVRITLLVVVALLGMLVLALWLVRRSLGRDGGPSIMRHCDACGKPTSDAATFCPFCGAKLT